MVNIRMAFVPSYAQGAYYLLVLVLACTSSGYGSIFPTPMLIPPPTSAPKECPLYNTQEGFKLQPVYTNKSCFYSNMVIYKNMTVRVEFIYLLNFLQFLGDWYVLEYIYNKPMRMKDLSCVGFHFSLTSFGELQSNFTFRFPAMTGHFYHVPTFSLISDQNQAIWDTQFRGGKSHS